MKRICQRLASRSSLAVIAVCTAALCAYAQPLQHRLMIATSRDGLNFTKTDSVVFNEADVPDAVVGPGGTVFLYFQGNLNGQNDKIIVGTSADGMHDWTFRPAQLNGIGAWKVRPCDPDVTFRNDTFRLYVTGDPNNTQIPSTYSLVSTDGISFTLEQGVRVAGGTRPVLDPSVLRIGDTLHFFAGGGGPERNWHAVSTDGLTFTMRPDLVVGGMMMSNGIAVPGGFRFYGFPNMPPQRILSVYTVDGAEWTMDAGDRLVVTPNVHEAMYVKDPAIVLRDSLYLMYYVTRKPEFAGVGAAPSIAPQAVEILETSPNPAGRSLTVRLAANLLSPIRMVVRDLLGRVVLSPVLDAVRPDGGYVIDISSLGTGSYYCSPVTAMGAGRPRRIVIAH